MQRTRSSRKIEDLMQEEHTETPIESELLALPSPDSQMTELLVRRLSLGSNDAEAVAAALAPTAEQIERLAADADSLFTVLSELAEAVQPVQLQHKVLTAALAKLLQTLKIPDTLAVEVADTLHLEPADFIPCLADPTKLPGVLHDWSSSEAFDTALVDLSKSVRKFMQELVGERLTEKRHRKLHTAALAAVQTFEMTRQHFEMIVYGDIAGVLKLVLVDAAAGAVDTLTAGLQNKVESAMKHASKLEQAAESAGQVADALGSNVIDDVMGMVGELGTFGKVAQGLYTAVKQGTMYPKECEILVKKVKRGERLAVKVKGVESLKESVEDVERIILKTTEFVKQSQQSGFFRRAFKGKSNSRILETLGKELDATLAALNTDAVLTLAAEGCGQEDMAAATRADEEAMQTLRDRVAKEDPTVPMETLAAGLPFSPEFLSKEIGDHMDELKQSLDELKAGQIEIKDGQGRIMEQMEQGQGDLKEGQAQILGQCADMLAKQEEILAAIREQKAQVHGDTMAREDKDKERSMADMHRWLAQRIAVRHGNQLSSSLSLEERLLNAQEAMATQDGWPSWSQMTMPPRQIPWSSIPGRSPSKFETVADSDHSEPVAQAGQPAETGVESVDFDARTCDICVCGRTLTSRTAVVPHSFLDNADTRRSGAMSVPDYERMERLATPKRIERVQSGPTEPLGYRRIVLGFKRDEEEVKVAPAPKSHPQPEVKPAPEVKPQPRPKPKLDNADKLDGVANSCSGQQFGRRRGSGRWLASEVAAVTPCGVCGRRMLQGRQKGMASVSESHPKVPR